MRKTILTLLILTFLISACNTKKTDVGSEEQRIAFLSESGVVVDTKRPYYSSDVIIPKVFDTVWEIRDIFARDLYQTGIDKYKGKECKLYMYPVQKLPFDVKKESSIETRAVVMCYEGSIICSYIEFISELRTLPPMSLRGESLIDISSVSWNDWRNSIDSDGNKKLVIWQYYEDLRLGNYENAYWFLYDKKSISEQDFIKAASENFLPRIDFLEIGQYKDPTTDESYFVVNAMVASQGSAKKKKYEIVFDLKRDPKESQYSGWKIYRTKIK